MNHQNPTNMKKNVWQIILKVVIAVATAVAGVFFLKCALFFILFSSKKNADEIG